MIGLAAFFAGQMEAVTAVCAVGVLIEYLTAAALINATDFPLPLQLGKVAVNGADTDALAA